MLLSNFNLLATAPGGVARLRELIMTLAVQGKLVPQDPLDEPADVLLQKIRAEKDRLIAEGKIKRDKPVLPIAEQEKSFGLPAGWEWVRVGQIASRVQYGFTASADHSITQPKLLRITDIQNDQVNWDTVPGVKVGSQDVSGYFLANGDLLIARTGGTIGKSFLVDVVPVDSVFASYLIRISPLSGLTPQYLKTFASSANYWNQVLAQSMGTGQPNVNGTALSALVLALPPLAEQSRIVARVEELMRVCDALEAKCKLEAAQHAQLVTTLLDTLTGSDTPEALAENWQRIAAHFDLLLDRPQAIDAFEQTILQLAVRGLLVPQDPGDEPASVLLKMVRAEKDRLIAEGEIRRDKPLAAIAEEEKPFEVPIGWEWSTLAEIGIINPRNNAADDVTASFVQMSSIPVAFLAPHITEPRPWRDIKSGFTQFAEGDVGVAKITPCFENGKSTVFQNLSNGIGAGTTELHIVRPLCRIVPKYVLLFLKTPSFLIEGEAMMTGSAGQKRMPRNYFENKPFPLPPLDEQARIVTRVEELHHLCADLRQRLSASQTTQSHLAEALVQSVTG